MRILGTRLLLAPAAVAALAAPTLAAPTLVAPASATAASSYAARDVHATLTLKVKGCEGCEVGAVSASTADYGDLWDDLTDVEDGEAVFSVPSDKMQDLSFTITAPWEGATGYVTGIVARYGHVKPGEKIGFTAARRKSRASGCWAGSDDLAVTLKVRVRKVRVNGIGGKVWGTMAWFKRTVEWQQPMQPAWKGVIGRQDVLFCEPKDG